MCPVALLSRMDDDDDVMLSASSIADEKSISLDEKEKKADLTR